MLFTDMGNLIFKICFHIFYFFYNMHVQFFLYFKNYFY